MIAFLNTGKINILKISYMLPGKIFSSFYKKASSQVGKNNAMWIYDLNLRVTAKTEFTSHAVLGSLEKEGSQ